MINICSLVTTGVAQEKVVELEELKPHRMPLWPKHIEVMWNFFPPHIGLGKFSGDMYASAGGFNGSLTLKGAQFGLINMAVLHAAGLQLGVINGGPQLTGVQLGAINISADVRGVQLGIYNNAERLKGVQIGLFNEVESNMNGVQVGLVNVRGMDSERSFIPFIRFQIKF